MSAPKHRQGGYLYELPLMVIITVFLTAFLYPLLAPPWNTILLGLPVVALLVFIIYGWSR